MPSEANHPRKAAHPDTLLDGSWIGASPGKPLIPTCAKHPLPNASRKQSPLFSESVQKLSGSSQEQMSEGDVDHGFG